MRGVVLAGVFAITWFLTLFILLPIGIHEGEEPWIKLRSKFFVATAIAIVAVGAFYGLVHAGLIGV